MKLNIGNEYSMTALNKQFITVHSYVCNDLNGIILHFFILSLFLLYTLSSTAMVCNSKVDYSCKIGHLLQDIETVYCTGRRYPLTSSAIKSSSRKACIRQTET